MKHAILPIVAGALAFACTVPHARATLSLVVEDNGVPVSGTTITTPPGTLTFTSAKDPNFTALSVTMGGVPAIPSPDLATVTISAHSAGTGTHILTVDALQSGLTNFAGGSMTTTFTTNALIGTPGPTDMAMIFAGTTIASHSFPVGDTTDTFKTSSALGAQAGPFSDEQTLAATFSGGVQVLETAAQFKATSVPEPAAIGVFAIGLLGLAMAYRRRRA